MSRALARGDVDYVLRWLRQSGAPANIVALQERALDAMVGRSPVGSPAHTSGCESPDPSPDCPRCVALTRERDEAREKCELARESAALNAQEAIAAARDLAQARQALRQLVDAIPLFEEDAVDEGAEEWETASGRIGDAMVAAREALVGTREKDLGGSQSEPCAGGPCGVCGFHRCICSGNVKWIDSELSSGGGAE